MSKKQIKEMKEINAIAKRKAKEDFEKNKSGEKEAEQEKLC